MKTNSKQLPKRVIDLGNGQHHINFNVVESVDENGGLNFDYDTALVNGEPNYENIVASIIADKYRLSDELAMVNNFLAGQDIEEYNQYQHYRRKAKAVAAADHLITTSEYESIL